MERKKVYSNDYIALYSDGEIGVSDGVGYIETIDASEVMELYDALKKLLEEKLTSDNSKSMPCSHETYNDITSKVHVCSECHKVFWR